MSILNWEVQNHLFRKNIGTASIKCYIPAFMEGWTQEIKQSPKAIKQYCIFPILQITTYKTMMQWANQNLLGVLWQKMFYIKNMQWQLNHMNCTMVHADSVKQILIYNRELNWISFCESKGPVPCASCGTLKFIHLALLQIFLPAKFILLDDAKIKAALFSESSVQHGEIYTTQ